jgi:hypothetical protein
MERPRTAQFTGRPPPGPPPVTAPFTAPQPARYLAGGLSWRLHSDELRYGQILRRLAGLALRHPGLLPPLLAAGWRFRSRDWYRRAPYLPLPPAEYIAWRLHTAYGSEEAVPSAPELERYLRWSARMRKRERRADRT